MSSHGNNLDGNNLEDFDDLEDFDEEEVILPKIPVTNTSATILFSDLQLCEEIQRSIKEAQFENPSPVQALAIPKVILGRDVLCQAKSGTGKTAVFVLGVLQLLSEVKLDRSNFTNELDRSNSTNNFTKYAISYLVIAHTKELVEQIKEEFLRFSKYLNIYIGDISMGLDRLDILIGTPNEIFSVINLIEITRGIVVDECDMVVGDRNTRQCFGAIASVLRRDD